MIPDEMTEPKLSAAMDGARLVYFDSRMHDTALVVAQEVIATYLSMFFSEIFFLLKT